MPGLGHQLAFDDFAAFSDRAGLIYAAQTMIEHQIWVLTLSPPDPDAGVWSGTIGPGGTVIWPSPIDPNPPPGGASILDDPFPTPISAQGVVVTPISDVQQLAPGDAVPIT